MPTLLAQIHPIRAFPVFFPAETQFLVSLKGFAGTSFRRFSLVTPLPLALPFFACFFSGTYLPVSRCCLSEDESRFQASLPFRDIAPHLLSVSPVPPPANPCPRFFFLSRSSLWHGLKSRSKVAVPLFPFFRIIFFFFFLDIPLSMRHVQLILFSDRGGPLGSYRLFL